MKISAKGKYAIAAMVKLTAYYKERERVSVIVISEALGISKIYLEQVFSLLRKGGLVESTKGAQGGYILAKEPGEITCYDILMATETNLTESLKDIISDKVPEINDVVNEVIYEPINGHIESTLKGQSLESLAGLLEEKRNKDNFMFYI